MSVPIDICSRCILPVVDVFKCNTEICSCNFSDTYRVWQCLMCAKQHLLESDADFCDQEDTRTLFILAFEEDSLPDDFSDLAQKLKPERDVQTINDKNGNSC